MKIKIYTKIFPTEDVEKIKKSLENIFKVKFKKTKNKIYFKTNKLNVLENIRNKILESRIKNTVLYLIEKNKTNNSSKIELNKQAIVIGKINFVEEKYPLGNVVIEFDDVEKISKYLTFDSSH